MKIQVYLNESLDDAPALRLAAVVDDWPETGDSNAVLGRVFRQHNLSVGDVVIIDQALWVARNGWWEQIATDDLLAAISRFHHVIA